MAGSHFPMNLSFANNTAFSYCQYWYYWFSRTCGLGEVC